MYANNNINTSRRLVSCHSADADAHSLVLYTRGCTESCGGRTNIIWRLHGPAPPLHVALICVTLRLVVWTLTQDVGPGGQVIDAGFHVLCCAQAFRVVSRVIILMHRMLHMSCAIWYFY